MFVKMLLLSGSSRHDGLSMRMADRFLTRFADRFPEWEFSDRIFPDAPPAPCTGCGECDNKYDCRCDDLEELWKDVEESDLIVLSAPVYFRGLPAPVKAFIDRTQRLYMAVRRGELPLGEKKRAFVLLLSAGTRCEDGSVVEAELKHALPLLGADPYRMILANGSNYGEALTDEVGAELDRVADEYAAIVAQRIGEERCEDE